MDKYTRLFNSLSIEDKANLEHLCFPQVKAVRKGIGRVGMCELFYKIGVLLNEKDPDKNTEAYIKALAKKEQS